MHLISSVGFLSALRIPFARWGALLLIAAIGSSLGSAQTPAASPLTFSADVRLRYESDWDSHTAAGARRTDRERGRTRVRLGANYAWAQGWSAGARLRTGNRLSQQSPHLSFWVDDGSGSDKLQVQLDRYFIQYKGKALTGWAGRNSSPFWQQNELFWDEDVTPTGIAGSYEKRQNDGVFTATAGVFALPDGMEKLNGRLGAAQAKYSFSSKPSQTTVAAGVYRFFGDDGAQNLRNRNGARDYLVGLVSAQYVTPLGGTPFTIGADLIKNFENYNNADVSPLPSFNKDETFGYVLSGQYGRLKEKNDWLVAYFTLTSKPWQ